MAKMELLEIKNLNFEQENNCNNVVKYILNFNLAPINK